MGKIFWSSLLNKSVSSALILGPTVQDCSYWRRKNDRSSRKDGLHASSEGCPTHWAGQSTKAVHGEESPSPTEHRGCAVAGQGCCSAEHVRCLPCQQQRP